jgi:hypothetical protein
VGIGFFIVLMMNSYAQQDDFPVLKGPYLGQTPPGETAEIFAPGIISGGISEGCCAFLKGGTVFIFRRSLSRGKDKIYEMHMKNGIWTKPVPASFKSLNYDGDFTVAPDDKTLYFSSRRAKEGGENASEDTNIWKTELTAKGWSEQIMLKAPVNSDKHDAYPSKHRKLVFGTALSSAHFCSIRTF